MENLQVRIKTTRINRGLSQAALAEKTGVSQPTVANWENGSHVPRPNVLEKIGDALGVTPIWLISGIVSDAESPAQNYMEHPIRHLPVFNWPNGQTDFPTERPTGFMPFATRKEGLFGLLSDSQPSKSYDIIIVDPASFPAEKQGEYIVFNEGNAESVQSETTDIRIEDLLGKIVARMTFYR